MTALIQQLDAEMSMLPPGITLTEVASVEPLDIGIYTNPSGLQVCVS
jgi:hypothetical protein